MGDMSEYYGYCDPEPDLEEMEEMELSRKPSRRLDWMDLWDKLRNDLKTGNTTWGRNQILELMDRLEREMVREFERKSDVKEDTIEPSLRRTDRDGY